MYPYRFFMLRLLIALCLFLPYLLPASGSREVDSLITLLEKPASEASRAEIDLHLSELLAKNECAKAKAYALAALGYYQSSGDEKHQAKAFECAAGACTFAGDFEQAVSYNMRALNLYEKFNDKKSGSYIKAKLGLVYYQMGNYTRALSYYKEAMSYYEETNDQEGFAFQLNNIATIYEKQEKYDSALINLEASLQIKKKLNDLHGIANSINNIGNIYFHKADYPQAIDYYKRSLAIKMELNDKPGQANTLQNIGYGYYYLKNYEDALSYVNRGLRTAQEIKNKHYIKEAYVKLSEVYQAMKNWEKAFEYSQLYGAMKDSIYNETSSRQIAEMETKYQTEKKEKELQVERLDSDRKQIIIYAFGAGLLLLLLLAFFIYRGYIEKKNAHLTISLQKEEVEKQKHMVEEKNREMLGSINYARRIQDALLREEEHITEHLPPHFILFRAKDIVSGDFYWGVEKQHYWYLCVADCTGHGVPGAFMSMLGIAYLNEITASGDLLKPSDILDGLRNKIVKELKQTGHDGESKDGMDISILRLDIKTNEMQWAGANNPVYHIRNKKLVETKGDKQPIGFSYNPHPFTNHTIGLQPGDAIYLFSDGYADQFGGPKGKKFKYRQLQETLLTIHMEPVSAQKEFLSKRFDSWRGKLEQVDDVTLVGLRI